MLVQHTETEGRQVLCPICVDKMQAADQTTTSSSRTPAVVPLYDFAAHLQLRHMDLGANMGTFGDHGSDQDPYLDHVGGGGSAAVEVNVDLDQHDHHRRRRRRQGHATHSDRGSDADTADDEVVMGDSSRDVADAQDRDSGGEGDDDDDGDASVDEDVEIDPKHMRFLVEELTIMGFPEQWCTIALQKNHCDVATASSWIVDNLEMLSTLDTDTEEVLDEVPFIGGAGNDDSPSSDHRAKAANESSTAKTGADERSRLDELLAEDGDPIFQESFYPGNAPSVSSSSTYIAVGDEDHFFGSTALDAFPLHNSSTHHSLRSAFGADSGRRRQHAQVLVGMHQREEALAVLYAREATLVLICESGRNSDLVEMFAGQPASKSAPPSGDTLRHPLVSHDAVFRYLQLVLFRGYSLSCQLHHSLHCDFLDQGVVAAVQPTFAFGDNNDAQASAAPGAVVARHVPVCHPAYPRQPQAFMEHPQPSGAAQQPTPSKDSNGYDPADPAAHHTWLLGIVWAGLFQVSSPDLGSSGGATQLLVFLANQALLLLESAASLPKHRATKWHARLLATSDSAAAGSVSVELAEWLLRLVVSRATRTPQNSPLRRALEHEGNLLSLSWTRRLSQCMYSGNVGLKQSTSTVLTWLLMYLHQKETGAGAQPTVAGETPSSSVSVHGLVADVLPLSLVRRMTVRRMHREKALGRIFYSSYLRSLLDLFVALYDVENYDNQPSSSVVSTAVPDPTARPSASLDAPGGDLPTGVESLSSQLLSPVQLEERYANRVGLAWHVYWPEASSTCLLYTSPSPRDRG